MKDLILIDIKQTALCYKHDSFQKGFLYFLEQFKAKNKIDFRPGLNYDKWYKVTIDEFLNERDLSASFEKLIRELFFTKLSTKELEESFVALTQTWESRDKKPCLYYADPAFNHLYLYNLRSYYNVALFFRTNNRLKRFFMKLILSKLLPTEIIFDYDSVSFQRLVDSYDGDRVHVVSHRPKWIQDCLLGKYGKLASFDYSKNFVYVTGVHFKVDTLRVFDEEANKLGVRWDLMALRFLSNRLLVMKAVNDKIIDFADLKVFGVCINRQYIAKGITLNFFQDVLPVMFIHYDPLSARQHSKIDIVHVRWPYCFKDHGINKLEDMVKSAEALKQQLDQQSKSYRSGARTAYLIHPDFLREYFHRGHMLEMFKQLFQSEKFINKLAKKGIRANIKVPTTLNTREKDFQAVR